MSEPGRHGGDSDSQEDRLLREAEELMRQGRFRDAASRYHELRRHQPTDLWVSLGHASALECAGDIGEAQQVIDEAARSHRRSRHLRRFLHMFFVRREDHHRAQLTRETIEEDPGLEDGPADQLGDLYFNQGRYREALAEFERVRREDPPDDEALRASLHARLGASLRQLGDLESAQQELLAALAIEPDAHWALCELAEVERGLGQVEAARRHYLQALVGDPDDHWCRGHLAQLEHEQGDDVRAIALYEEIIAASPSCTWALVELAQVLTGLDAARSERLCQQALEIDGSYPWAYAHLGVLARNAGRHKEAVQRFKDALQASPSSTWIMHELADSCRALGRMEEAYTHLEHARSLNPFDATTYGYMADLLRSENRHVEALAHLAKAVELDEGYAWAWREIAELRAIAGEHEAADQACRKACDLEPDLAMNDGLKAFLLRCRGERMAAVPYLERAIEIDPSYQWAWRELAEGHLARGAWAEAERVLRRGLGEVGAEPGLRALLAEALRGQGRYDEARTLVEQALEANPRMPQIWALRAELELGRDPGHAVRYARRAVGMDAQPEFRVLLAQALVVAGRAAQAQTELAAVLQTERPPPAAFDLAADLAVRAGRDDEAQALVGRGLTIHAGDRRLLLRRARVDLAAGRTTDLAALDPCFAGGPAPWRDLAQALARGGDAVAARRAAYRMVEEATDAASAGRAWLFLAEVELTLHHRREAIAAAERALRQDPSLVTARVLACLLAGEERSERAAEHLAELRRQSAAVLAQGGPVLLAQVAELAERLGSAADAEALWAEVAAVAEPPVEVLVERARRGSRLGDEAGAAALLAAEIDRRRDRLAGDEAQTLLHELALSRFRADGAEAAISVLEQDAVSLSSRNRLLFGQLSLAANRPEMALEQAARLDGSGGVPQRAGRLLAARARLARHEHAACAEVARALLAADAADEEAACVLAQAEAAQGRLGQALDLLMQAELPATPRGERALFAGCLLLELDGPAAGVAWLARHREALDDDLGLVRLLGAAWPGPLAGVPALADDADPPLPPPFPAMVAHLARALLASGRPALAASMLRRTLDKLDAPPADFRRLHRLAASALLAAGRRGAACGQAWAARSPSALFACLWPRRRDRR